MVDKGSSHQSGTALKSTPLFGLHEELGARMVPFAGYLMPVPNSSCNLSWVSADAAGAEGQSAGN